MSDPWGNAVTLAAIGTSDCTTVTSEVLANMPATFTATPNTAKGPGTMVCLGTVGSYPVTVISDTGWNAVCTDNGFTAAP